VRELLGLISDYGFLGVLLALFILIFQTRVITLLTAHYIELRLASKEVQYARKTVKTIAEVLIAYFFMAGQTFGFYQLNNINIGLTFDSTFIITIIIAAIVIIWSKIIARIKKRNPEFVLKNLRLFAGSIVFLMAFLFLLPPLYVASFITDIVKLDTKQILLALVLILYFTFILVFTFKYINGEFENDVQKETSLFVEINKKIWYIQYRTRDNCILLSDNQFIDKSQSFIFIEWQEFLKQNLVIEQQKSGQQISGKHVTYNEQNN
jgi:hypothetical protein